MDAKPRQPIRPTLLRSLIARLLAFNMLGLLILVGGFLTLQESRQILTNAYQQSLEAQANLVAGALAQTARPQSPFEFLEPNMLEHLFPGANPAQWQIREAGQVISRARMVSNSRMRLYARNGRLLLDSAHLDRSARIISRALPPMQEEGMAGFVGYIFDAASRFWKQPKPLLTEINAANGGRLAEVVSALNGQAASAQRQSEAGGDILTVAVPVQGYRTVVGALMVSTPPGEINALLGQERQLILQLSAIALAVNIGTSLLLAATMVLPVRRLAAAMRGFSGNAPNLPGLETIPDLSHRGDEIAELSQALRDMTERLLSRINTIDRFAADVAHELKNPLTSLHSAVQTLEQAGANAAADPTNPDHARLMQIIHHDINRLNRLISDISKATRLDAELNLGESQKFDLSRLAADLAEGLQDNFQQDHGVALVSHTQAACAVLAQQPRIAQIIDNLLINAVSFTPSGGRVFLTTRIDGDKALLMVADEGPGLAPDTQDKIFERFYTDRSKQPDRDASQRLDHSGLGLSISRQIARAHGGDLTADNRPDTPGAYFTLSLPLAAGGLRGRSGFISRTAPQAVKDNQAEKDAGA
jgi:two-component system, OmpR family, sensor histidine kinase ChvG